MKTALFLLLTFVSACEFEGGGVVDIDKNKTIECTDSRDGEVFTFNTNTMRDTRIGITTSSSFKVTDIKGQTRNFNDGTTGYLKCTIKQGE